MINEITSRWVFLQGITCSQPEISTTSGSKVMAYYVIFTKAVTLTLTVILFSKNLKCQGPMNCIHQLPKESERSDQYCDLYTLLRRTNKQTNKQTNRQTDRQTAVTNILCKNLRFCKVTNGDEYITFAQLRWRM